jgi:hypothetical protein
MNKTVFFILLWLFTLSACKNSAKISSVTPSKLSSKQLQKNMDAVAFDFNFLQAKAKVNYADENMNQSFTASFRLQKNQKIWISLTGPFGIEGARVLITKNNIQIIDRLNGKFYDEPFEFINNYLPFKADLAFIQNIIVGNAFQKEWSKQKVEISDDLYSIDDEFNGIDASYLVTNQFKYHSVQMNEIQKNRNIKMNFNDYRFIEAQLFAMIRQIQFSDGTKIMQIELDFTKIRKEQDLDFPFSVPDKMKN